MNKKIKAFLPIDQIEEAALQQIKNTASLDIVKHHVAVMPDCHYGRGATVGTVIATKDAIIPAAVGVDIGCGMIAVRTLLKPEDLKDLKFIREGIERRVPVSAGKYNRRLTESASARIAQLDKLSNDRDYRGFDENWPLQLGTLGGGNHFIEISVDELERVWVVLHSGSRGVGNKIGNTHIKIAQEIMKEKDIKVPDPDLSYITHDRPEFYDYLQDVYWAQEFARMNREEMMDRVLDEISWAMYEEVGRSKEFEIERINCHHNFVSQEEHFGEMHWITRKGAIPAKEGQQAIIPGSMGTKSYIVSGLGNPDSFNSAPHGAGRRMSRAAAKKEFTLKDLQKAMKGIEFNPKEAFIDEIPGAYKDIDVVMENSKELVKVEHVLKQLINVKGE